MKKHLLTVLAAALAIVIFPALASAQAVTVENNTGAKLTELYISNADTNSWEGNVLAGKTLAPGDSFKVTFNGRYMMYDLKAVFEGGQEQPYYGINVRKYSYVRLNPGGVESYK
jgi:hypothetical protein